MTRPGLIIGIGGTGQWVLTFVKKELLEINNQKMPDNVKLLAFDTLPQATAEAEKAGGEQEIKVGKVKLHEKTEFIHIGADVYPLSERTVDGQEPHIGSWFQAGYFKNEVRLPRASYNLSAGAGAIRPLGRLGIFNDLQAPTTSKLWSHLTTAIRNVKNSVNTQSQLEIIIVGSLAGGTGSGMFLDVANLVRSAADEVLAANFILRGMFVLPRAFKTQDRAMWARAFAAWRELDHFMFNDPALGRKTVIYNYENDRFHLKASERLFDGCYLIDPARASNSLTGIKPEQGVFPSVADIISAILDTTAGGNYTEWVTTNLATGYNERPGKAMHSSLGAFTIRVPIYHMMQEASHDLAISFLNQLLVPERQGSKVVGVAANRNPNAPGGEGVEGREEAFDWLAQSSISRQGSDGVETITATLLPGRIHEILKEDTNRAPATQTKLVTQHADSGMISTAGKSLNSLFWLIPYTTLGSDQQSKQIQQEISDAVNSNLKDKVPGARVIDKEEPPATYNRIVPKVSEFKTRYIGSQTAKGEFVGGAFRVGLDKCATEHIRRFRLALEMKLNNILMPENKEGRPPAVGTLGYAIDFAEGLVIYLNNFLEFMGAVKKDRMEKQPQNAQFERTQKMLQLANSTKGQKGFIGVGYSGTAYDNINAYMAAEQQLINIYKTQILHDYVESTAVRMRDYARKLSQELRNWAIQLAVGDSASNTRSLYELLQESLDYVESSRRFDAQVQQVRQNVGDTTKLLTDEEKNQYLTELLNRVVWTTSAEADRPLVKLDIAPLTDPEGKVTSPGVNFTNSSGDASRLNPNAIRSVTESYLRGVMRTKMVAPVLAGLDRHDGEALANRLNDRGEPLYQKTGNGPGLTSAFVRVHFRVGDSRIEETFSNAETHLKELNPEMSVNIRLIESDDAYKCTIVRSDDLIESRDFAVWHELRREYINYITDEHNPVDPRSLHILPAEVNASYYERQLDKLQLTFRTFDPRVVVLLEDMSKVRLFFLSHIFGLIKEDEEDNQVWYELSLPDMEEPLRLTPSSQNRADIFVLMNSFVNRGRDVRPRNAGKINYAKVTKTLNQEMAESGNAEQLMQHLEREMKHGELLRSLMEAAGEQYDEVTSKREGGREFKRQEYADLADLMRLILLEEVTALRNRSSSTARTR